MAMTTRVNTTHVMARQAGKQRQQSQQLPRPARVRFSAITTGVGETRLTGAKALNFGALILEEPTFTWGVTALSNIPTGSLPQCTAIVLKYLQNKNGVYTGAEVGFMVDAAQSNIKLQFSLTFEGATMRSTLGTTPSTTNASDNTYNGADPNASVQVDSL